MKIAVEANKRKVTAKDEHVDEIGDPMKKPTTKEEKARQEVEGEGQLC